MAQKSKPTTKATTKKRATMKDMSVKKSSKVKGGADSGSSDFIFCRKKGG